LGLSDDLVLELEEALKSCKESEKKMSEELQRSQKDLIFMSDIFKERKKEKLEEEKAAEDLSTQDFATQDFATQDFSTQELADAEAIPVPAEQQLPESL